MADSRSASLPGVVDALIEALPEAVFVVGPDLRLLAINALAVRLMPALRKDESLVRGMRAPDVLDAVARVLDTGQPQAAFWLDRVPFERHFEIHLRPLEAGGWRACVVTLHDVTEALRIDRMRADFVANASHELRTPLASLLGFVETLQGPARDDAVAREKFLEIMKAQARRMARLVDDLLSLSRIEQNQHVRPEAPIDLALVARHVADTLAPLAMDMGVDLKVDASQPVIVAGDRDELVRVAENLIENAIKYGASPDGANTERVEIAVTRTAREGWLSVRDYGRGIAPEHLPRLTERFYRIDAGQSRSKGGTGLGLAIVKHIMARHRGRLTISSQLGLGSTFTAMAPLHPGQID
jgi:two-component system, OmpR family, phosphate regulon sensor histidine kinase PhoR